MEDKPIPETLGYLLAHCCRAHRNRAQELLSGLGLHTGQEMLLMNLWIEDGLTQSALAERLCIQPPTLTRALDRLEQAHLVTRRPDTEDRRTTRVYVTRQGLELRQSVENAWQQLEMQSFGSLSQEERHSLRQLLERVYASLT